MIEKYGNLLELFVIQLVIQSNLKNQNVNVVRSKVRYFSYSTKVIQV